MGIRDIIPKYKDIHIEDDVLRPMRRLLAPHARKRHVQLIRSIGFELIPIISSDPDLLSVIFYNLFDNAIKYSQKDSEIRVFCHRTTDEYQIDVCNYGPEIEEDEREKVFAGGYRGINVRKREVGLGLGLFISRNIARNLGYSLELIGTGCAGAEVTFRLRIPKEI